MFEVMVIYDGKDSFSLCQDIRRIFPDASMADLRAVLANGETLDATEAQYEALVKLKKLYATLDVGKV